MMESKVITNSSPPLQVTMPLRPNSSLVAWTAAVTVPLAILAVLAGLGISAQKSAARSRVQDEAAAISSSQAQLISRQLNAAIEEIPQFPDPPVPVSAPPIDGILDGTDLEELRRLRDDPDAGLSSAGLPRRALAALRLEALAPGEQKAEELSRLLAEKAPSVLTLPALLRLREQHDDFVLPAAWQLIMNFDELRAANPTGGWIDYNDQAWWISADGK